MSHQESDALHGRVRGLIDHGQGLFDEIACDIARFQASHIPAIARLYASRGIDARALRASTNIPALPCDAFRLRRIAAHQQAQDERCFITSGTTATTHGKHAMRSTETYRRAALSWAQTMLWPDQQPLVMLALLPTESERPDSSLTFMAARFADAIGSGDSWHFSEGELNLKTLRARIENLDHAALVVGTSFAFVHLLDQLGGERLPLPVGSRIMQTGGFKGRSRQVEAATLRKQLAEAFGIEEAFVVAEYGMTELSSQLYQGTLRARLGCSPEPASVNAYYPPPWVHICAVDPISLDPCDGEGIARIVDLANVDSAVAVQTSDRIRSLQDGGIELLGRMPGATPRGCSLALEHLIER